MKDVLILWLALITCIQAAGLDFGETLKELHPAADVTRVTTDFEFTNRTDKPVTVKRYDAACSCLAVTIKGGKLHYEPGESGVVRTEFDVGNLAGVVDKSTMLWLDGDPEDKPSLALTVRLHIPVLVSLEPKTLKWELNGKPEPQIFHLKMSHVKPIKVLSVVSSSEAYSHELKTIEDGKTYDLVVTPVDIKTPGLAIFRITTDCDIPRFKFIQAFAQVRKALAKQEAAKP